jgi:hypothetical protein
MQTKHIAYVALATTGLLLVPLIAMQFTNEVNWTAFDFLVGGGILLSSGFAFLSLLERSASIYYRLGAGLSVAAAFLLVWANLAVGFIGSGPNPANLMYGGILVIGILGSIRARFRPAGMAYTMFALALAQVLVPLIALSLWDIKMNIDEGRAIAGITSIFITMWVGAALLFRKAEHSASARGKGIAIEG